LAVFLGLPAYFQDRCLFFEAYWLVNCGTKTYQMQTLQVEIIQQILLLMPYRDCLRLAKTSKYLYSIFTSCYYHSAKIEDIDHWMKFLMTGYIPPALKVPSHKRNENLEVRDGILIKLHLFGKRLTLIPDSIGNLVNLDDLYFYII
jgi:hypothetical protein